MYREFLCQVGAISRRIADPTAALSNNSVKILKKREHVLSFGLKIDYNRSVACGRARYIPLLGESGCPHTQGPCPSVDAAKHGGSCLEGTAGRALVLLVGARQTSRIAGFWFGPFRAVLARLGG